MITGSIPTDDVISYQPHGIIQILESLSHFAYSPFYARIMLAPFTFQVVYACCAQPGIGDFLASLTPLHGKVQRQKCTPVNERTV